MRQYVTKQSASYHDVDRFTFKLGRLAAVTASVSLLIAIAPNSKSSRSSKYARESSYVAASFRGSFDCMRAAQLSSKATRDHLNQFMRINYCLRRVGLCLATGRTVRASSPSTTAVSSYNDTYSIGYLWHLRVALDFAKPIFFTQVLVPAKCRRLSWSARTGG